VRDRRRRTRSAGRVDLAARLEEAEATLAAIRSGEVDALLVSGVAGEQVYALRSADHPYRVLVERMREGAVTVAHGGLILYANPYFAHLLRRRAETIVGTAMEQYVVPEHRPLLDELLREGEGQSAECHLVTATGDAVPVYLSVSRLEIDERPVVCVVVTDLSAEKRRDAAERGRAEAEAANRAKDDFLAIVSHELRSPLSAVLTWVHVLRSGRLDASRMDHALETVERSVRLQVRIIEDLLDVSRIVSGQLALDLTTIELPTVVEAAIEGVRGTAEAKGIRLECALESENVAVRGDSARLDQVLNNLLSNAVKFTAEGGTIRIALQRVGTIARLVVRDTGPGILPEFLPYVFHHFRQADTSSTRRHGGLGLGLSIVRHIVELHGGSVSAENAIDGPGAVFTISLPVDLSSLDRVRGKRPQAPGDDARDLTGIRVLVVDDDESARDAFAAALTAWGADVLTAASAGEALQTLAEGQAADVLISDIAMPGADGYSLLRRVRAPDAAERGLIPAIAISGYASPADRQRAMAAGFQAHLAKPVEPDDLAATVARLARGS
jgi:PAS domain S-box-containing protein